MRAPRRVGRPTRAPGFAAALKAVGRRRRAGQLGWPSAAYWEALLTICEEHAEVLFAYESPWSLFKQIAVASDSILRQKLIEARLGGGGDAKKELSELRRLINGDDEPDAKET